jgi:hypothetical protein
MNVSKSDQSHAKSGEDRSRTDANGRSETASRAKRSARKAAAEFKNAGSTAKREVRDKLERGKLAAGRKASETTEALDDLALDLSDEGHETLAQATSEIATRLAQLADYVESKSLDDLTREARSLARRSPGLMIAGGVVIGFALTRFLKASSRRADEGAESGEDSDAPSVRAGAAGRQWTYADQPGTSSGDSR